MNLHYLHTGESLRALVMVRDNARAELHVRPIGDGWVLVVVAGHPQCQPARHHWQGPYPNSKGAESALRSTVQAMLGRGFRVERALHSIWTVQAQRLARAVRDGHEPEAGREAFDPDSPEPL